MYSYFSFKKERHYIVSSLAAEEDHEKILDVPWLKILSSLPFWAILINHTAANWVHPFFLHLTRRDNTNTCKFFN